MITGSIDIIIQASRLRDGSRKVTHITEVLGMEGDVVTLQNLIVFDITGEDATGQAHRPPPLHRHCAAALLGARRILRRGSTAWPRRWPLRGPDANGNPLGRSRCLRVITSSMLALAAGAPSRSRAVVFVFLDPYLSGERESRASRCRALPRRAKRSRCARRAETAANRRKAGRRHAEGYRERARRRMRRSRCVCAWSGRPRNHAATVLDRERALRRHDRRPLPVGHLPLEHVDCW